MTSEPSQPIGSMYFSTQVDPAEVLGRLLSADSAESLHVTDNRLHGPSFGDCQGVRSRRSQALPRALDRPFA